MCLFVSCILFSCFLFFDFPFLWILFLLPSSRCPQGILHCCVHILLSQKEACVSSDITSKHARVHFTGTGGEGLSCVPEFRIPTREVKYITVTRVQAPRHQSHTQQNCCCSICASLFIKRRGSIILDIGRKLELLEPAGEHLLN